MVVVCPSCGGELPDGLRFCGFCGERLPLRCGACGAPAAFDEQRFCGSCGASMQHSPAPPRERRLVSVMFCDLTGFTSFSEERDAEEVRDVLEQYFAAARRAVAAYGGAIEKFIGDAVMALWGAPVAREDDAERSVRAGLDIAAAVAELASGLAIPQLQVRVGILTGEAAVDIGSATAGLAAGGAHTGMVIGDAVNTAARIQSLAHPGTVLVDDVTRLASERSIAYEQAGTHSVKGRSAKVRVWRAVRVLSRHGGDGSRGAAVEPPLVGREAELATIRAAVDGLLAPEAEISIVTVAGEAGLGKTRLVWEFEKLVDGIMAPVQWLRGRSLGFSEEAGFSSLAEIVRMGAGIRSDDPLARQTETVEAWLAELQPGDLAERARIAAAVSRLLGLDDGSELIPPGALFSAWRALFERLAARTPLVLIFEELHRAGQGLFEFLAHLLDWCRGAPILVLGLGRPDPRLEQLAQRATRLDLEPLLDAQIDELVAGAVIDAPESLLRVVRAEGGGVPLYAVETLRSLADEGVLGAESGRYVVRGELGELTIPPTIRALVASRLDRLGQLERRVLAAGAVLGERFAAAGAAAIAGIDETSTGALLDGLVSKQLLMLDSAPRSPLRGRYSFLQGVVRRVLLRTLSRRVRKEYHLAAVQFLAGGGPEPELASALAGHLLEAAEAEPRAADAGALRRRGGGMLREAAERAFAVGAPEESLAFLDRAAELEPSGLARAAILRRAGEVAHRSGAGDAAAERFHLAGELYGAAGHERERLGLRAHELRALRYVRSPAELVPELTELVASLSDRDDSWRVFAGGVLAFTLYQCGRHEEALTVAQAAVAAGETGAAIADLLGPLGAQASSLAELERPEESIETFRRALAIAETHDPRLVASIAGNIALTLAALGRYEEAADGARDAISAAERSAERLSQRWARLVLGRALCALGEWDAAAAEIDSVRADVPPFQVGMATAPLVVIALARGELEHARELVAEHDRRCAAEDASVFESDFRALRAAVIACAQGDDSVLWRVIPEAEAADFAEWSGWLAPVSDMLVARAATPAVAARPRSRRRRRSKRRSRRSAARGGSGAQRRCRRRPSGWRRISPPARVLTPRPGERGSAPSRRPRLAGFASRRP